MTYFCNGTTGDIWEERNCSGCIHHTTETGCPVIMAHFLANHDQHGDDEKSKIVKSVLEILIPTNGLHPGPCSMRVPEDNNEAQKAVVKAQEDEQLVNRLEDAAAKGESAEHVVVTFESLQQDRDHVASGFPDHHCSDVGDRIFEMVGELNRMSISDTIDSFNFSLPEEVKEKAASERVDAIGSIVVSLAGYATACGLRLEKCILDSWMRIRNEKKKGW